MTKDHKKWPAVTLGAFLVLSLVIGEIAYGGQARITGPFAIAWSLDGTWSGVAAEENSATTYAVNPRGQLG